MKNENDFQTSVEQEDISLENEGIKEGADEALRQIIEQGLETAEEIPADQLEAFVGLAELVCRYYKDESQLPTNEQKLAFNVALDIVHQHSNSMLFS